MVRLSNDHKELQDTNVRSKLSLLKCLKCALITTMNGAKKNLSKFIQIGREKNIGINEI